MLRRAALVAVFLAPTLPLVAWAQVSPDRATVLQQQIQDWLQGTFGTTKKPIRVTAGADHFDLAVPLGDAPDAPVLTGKMTDAGSGRWAIDDISVPSPSVFHYRLPPAKTPDAPQGEITSTLTVGSQQQHILFDPTFATPSTSTSTIKDMSITTAGTNLTQLTHIDGGTGTATVTPVADGRVDVAINSALDGYTIKMSAGPAAQPVSIAMGKVSVIGNLAGVARDRAMQLAHQLSDKPSGTVPNGDKTAALLAVLTDLAHGVSLDEKAEDLTVSTPNVTGMLKLLSIGLTSTTEAGKLQARMPLAAQGLALPDMGLGNMATLIPTRLALTPSIGAVPTDAMIRIARKLSAKQDPADDDVAALFSQGPITAGIEDLSLDMAGASFTGSVNTLVTSPAKFSGTGKITAVDIDKLQQAMAADPQTAQFAPVVIFLKGIGRSEQSRLVWDIIYNDGRLLVNGQDMAALMGPPAQPTQPAQPAQPGRPRPARPAPARP